MSPSPLHLWFRGYIGINNFKNCLVIQDHISWKKINWALKKRFDKEMKVEKERQVKYQAEGLPIWLHVWFLPSATIFLNNKNIFISCFSSCPFLSFLLPLPLPSIFPYFIFFLFWLNYFLQKEIHGNIQGGAKER